MNFRLFFLATLLTLGVASVCADQPSRYAAQVKQGILYYYPPKPDGQGQLMDQFCFQPNETIWYKTEWGIKFSWNDNAGSPIYIGGNGNSCTAAGNRQPVFDSITKDCCVDLIEFCLPNLLSQKTHELHHQHGWVAA
ncbi:hypothetical protein ACQY0O_006068 [Thecaphora frezii]